MRNYLTSNEEYVKTKLQVMRGSKRLNVSSYDRCGDYIVFEPYHVTQNFVFLNIILFYLRDTRNIF